MVLRGVLTTASNFIVLFLLSFLYSCIVALVALGIVSFKEELSFTSACVISFIVLTVGILFFLLISYLMASNGILL